MKRLSAFGLALLVTHAPASADGLIFSLVVRGNRYVCADLTQRNPDYMSGEGQWILGYWSGLNVAFNADVGESTTSSGVYGEVKVHCASHPSLSISQATTDVYKRMKGARK